MNEIILVNGSDYVMVTALWFICVVGLATVSVPEMFKSGFNENESLTFCVETNPSLDKSDVI